MHRQRAGPPPITRVCHVVVCVPRRPVVHGVQGSSMTTCCSHIDGREQEASTEMRPGFPVSHYGELAMMSRWQSYVRRCASDARRWSVAVSGTCSVSMPSRTLALCSYFSGCYAACDEVGCSLGLFGRCDCQHALCARRLCAFRRVTSLGNRREVGHACGSCLGSASRSGAL